MSRGRPHKPSSLKELEGNRSRKEIPPELPLQGTPELPDGLDEAAAAHFKFLAAEFGGVGVLKRADGPALAMLADLWSKYWRASEAYDRKPNGKLLRAVRGFKADWDRAAAKLGIQVIDRSRIVGAGKVQADEVEETYFKVTG